ncbi:uncharacterized protein LOC121730676 [Aricia agestis]|uniref:uncharacterized protein LOC121730676 n=1 Tax=Aricia agestis TaxID=91739 RepID=UPI001C206EE3|nr:uncharacterized protein LOC121730676 [Aricia agestis]
MKMKVFVLLACVTLCAGVPTDNEPRNIWGDEIMDVTDFSVYYDVKTNKTIKNIMPRPWYRPGWSLRLPFSGGPCECEETRCVCCTGIRIQTFNFDRRTCAILTYEPEDSTIDIEAKFNDVTVMKNTYSTRNPPPFCIPIPIPYLPPGLVDTCIRIFDISIVDEKLHACLDMDTRIDKAPIVILHFDCMDMGFSGISLSKPGGSGSDTEAASETQQNSDVFDDVIDNAVTTEKINSIRYI